MEGVSRNKEKCSGDVVRMFVGTQTAGILGTVVRNGGRPGALAWGT